MVASIRSETIALCTEKLHIGDSYEGIREISKQLNPLNIKILSMMEKLGPRNLLEVSRQCNIPFTTVYHRVAQLEARALPVHEVAILSPTVAKLGLVRCIQLVTSKAGEEETVTRALKLPNMWRVVERCEGAFTHHAIQLVPANQLQEFNWYAKALEDRGMIRSHRLILTGDTIPCFPDFSSYDPLTREWLFSWDKWFEELKTANPSRTISDQADAPIQFDAVDLQIVAYLELNSRTPFTEIAKKIGVSPQTVKYRYDTKLVPMGVAEHFLFDVMPYPVEMIAPHEVMLEFNDPQSLNKFYSLIKKLFFVINVSKVRQANTLFVSTWIPNQMVSRMFEFFSAMAKADLLESYSSVRLNFSRRNYQTISPEIFDNDTKTWQFNPERCLLEIQAPPVIEKGDPREPLVSSEDPRVYRPLD